jgi:hypothetical protein
MAVVADQHLDFVQAGGLGHGAVGMRRGRRPQSAMALAQNMSHPEKIFPAHWLKL